MAKLEFYTTRISMLILLAAFVFKFMHWPYTGILLVLGCSLYALSQYPFRYIFGANKYSVWRSFIGKVAGFSYSILAIGVLFNLMHWPFGGSMLMAACAGCAVTSILLVVHKNTLQEEEPGYYIKSVIKSVGFTLLSLAYMYIQWKRFNG